MEEKVQSITEAVGYRDLSRTFTLRTLITFFLLAAVHEWKPPANVATMHGLPRFHHSTVSKKAKEISYNIMKRLLALIVSKYNCPNAPFASVSQSVACGDSTTVMVRKTVFGGLFTMGNVPG